MPRPAVLVMLAILAAHSIALASPPAVPEDCLAQHPGVNARFDRVGDLYIGGQPDEATLRALVAGGVRTVVNLRTQGEMDNRERVPFDEAGVLEELGVTYVHVPVGGREYGWRPEVLDALRDAIATTDGQVLLHCQSGFRTSWAYAGYLIREKGVSLEDAWNLVGAMQDDPAADYVAALLGVDVTFEFAPEGDREPMLAPAPSEASVPATGLNAFTVVPPTVITDFPAEVSNVLARVGPIYVAGQPSPEAFGLLKDDGVTVVINLRGIEEMQNREWMPYDEEAVLSDLQLTYTHLPLGMEGSWNPALVDEVARVLSESKGKAVLHCAVAWCASLVWAAYLARHRGLDINDAMEQASMIYPLNIPFEKMLGRRIIRTIVEPG